MFTQNANVPKGLSQEQINKRYYLLYYQFIKHAFGLKYCNDSKSPLYIKIFFDLLPDKKEKNIEFKSFIQKLEQTDEFKQADLRIREGDIGEVISHNHVILQCMDIVLGAMQFRLNNLHKKKIPGSKFRGRKTIAKEKLYNHILYRIRKIYPGFNIGMSTGIIGDLRNWWLHPYRHWKFTPKNFEFNNELTKKRKCPAAPT